MKNGIFWLQPGKVNTMTKEPKYNKYSSFGYYFVEYPDGNISTLMPRKTAYNYASMFGGTVKKHSIAPFWIGYIDNGWFWFGLITGVIIQLTLKHYGVFP